MPTKKERKTGLFQSILEGYKNGLEVDFPKGKLILKKVVSKNNKKSEKTKLKNKPKKQSDKIKKKSAKKMNIKSKISKIKTNKKIKKEIVLKSKNNSSEIKKKDSIKSRVEKIVSKKLNKNSSLKEIHDKIKQETEEIRVIPLEKHHIKLVKVEEAKKPELKSKKQKLDISSIKEAVEKELKSGKISDFQAEVNKQRLPLSKIVPQEKNTKISNQKFVKTGIPGFDDLFEHGIPRGNSVLVAGGAGSGKTIFCLQTLFNHAKNGEKCLYMSFEESEERLFQHMRDFGWDPEPLIKKGTLLIKRFNPFDITRSVDALLMKAKGELLIDVEPIIFPKGFRPEMVVLDSLTAIASAFVGKEDSYRIYIEQLFRFFEQVNATSLLITETEQVPKMFSSTGVEEFLADGVIVLYAIKRGNVRENAIEVLKMRGENHKKKIVALQITDNGIVVYPNQEVFEGTD